MLPGWTVLQCASRSRRKGPAGTTTRTCTLTIEAGKRFDGALLPPAFGWQGDAGRGSFIAVLS